MQKLNRLSARLLEIWVESDNDFDKVGHYEGHLIKKYKYELMTYNISYYCTFMSNS